MKAITKNSKRSFRSGYGSYLSLLLIVAIAVSLFAGFVLTKPTILQTAENYIANAKFYDVHITSERGFTLTEDVQYFKDNLITSKVTPAWHFDVQAEDLEGKLRVFRLHSITEGVNVLSTVGRKSKLPGMDECVVDAAYFKPSDIGKMLTIDDEHLATNTFRITGLVNSPLYMSEERGTTDLGDGKIAAFIYLPESAFKTNCDFTDLYIRSASTAANFSDAYKKDIENYAKSINATITYAKEALYKTFQRDADAEIQSIRDEIDALPGVYDPKREMENSSYNTEKPLKEEKVNTSIEKYQNLLKELEDATAEQNEYQERYDRLCQELVTADPSVTDQIIFARNQCSAALEAISLKIPNLRTRVNLEQQALDHYASELETLNKNHQAELIRIDNDQSLATDRLMEELNDALAAKENLIVPDYTVEYRADETILHSFASDVAAAEGATAYIPYAVFALALLFVIMMIAQTVSSGRVEIAKLRQLGYHSSTIVMRYLGYGLRVGLIGSIIGYATGSFVYPKIVWSSFGSKYTFTSGVDYYFDLRLILITFGAILLCSVGVPLLSCYFALKVRVADELKGSSPRSRRSIRTVPGHPSLLRRSATRNIFTYKCRFFASILCIGLVSALLLIGVGMYDSAKNTLNKQFDEIQKYDYLVSFESPVNASEQAALIGSLEGHVRSDAVFANVHAVDVVNGKETIDGMLIAGQIKDAITLSYHGKDVAYPTGGCLIDESLARELQVKVGDVITINMPEGDPLKLPVNGLCDNFVGHRIYINPTASETANAAFMCQARRTATKVPTRLELTGTEATLRTLENVSSVTPAYMDREDISGAINLLKGVAMILIVCAALTLLLMALHLALSNANSRTHEFGVLKAIGYPSSEIRGMIFKENFIPALLAILLGGAGGWFLLDFVMRRIDVYSIHFCLPISWIGLAVALGSAIVLALVADLCATGKVNHADALTEISLNK